MGIKTSVVGRTGIHPVGDENICFTFRLSMTVGSPDQLLSIAREHRKSIETFIEGDLLKPCAVPIDQV